ncbi:helix-turn-helix domain-containing protein [Chitinophaga nivalis]|uniref:Helix-turn-helix domain-containing protein n=1 Tax=Chitinophaga nivalis TaxID=2991709 RepID=A0ABT3IGJ1_9BACT|nr:helix-turn-helix domain-containing protein [Chitinophaga nivalis]MCW3467229.1 helix-turn-helix domain-containing protein [Chitinophaga nivalis]MCW3483079.1 helix-turn-helix domain-containing protein [Chitinophaga nivalis]
MNAMVYTPKSALKEAVDYCWYHEATQQPAYTYSIPFLHQELIINFGDYLSLTGPSHAPFSYTRHGGVSGIFSGPLLTHTQGHYKAIGIIFKPFGLYRLLGFPAIRLEQGPLTLEQVLGPQSRQWVAQLENIADPMEKLYALENRLLDMARPQSVPDEIIFLPQYISLQKGHIQTQAHSTGISPKKYIRYYQQAVGLTPKKYMQLQLINQAITQIATTPDMPLTHVAYDLGFYDQAHFIRVFRSFAGMTPSGYRRAVQQGKVHLDFPNTIFC